MKDKVIVITGSTSGLGAAAVIAFAAQEATVVFCGRRRKEGMEIENRARAKGGDATFIQTDVTIESQVENLIAETIRLHGKIDVAFNNAGGDLYFGPLDDMTTEQFTNNIMLNLTG